jgi:uncharacterized SAM-binding protein YcdF (DUF218 family)
MPKKWYERGGTQDPVEGARGPRAIPVVVLVLLACLLVFLVARWWLPAMARALMVGDPAVHADAILVLGGGNGSRQDLAIEFYRAGLAPIIISSGERPLLPGFEQSYAEVAALYMADRGVARDAILLLPLTTSTQDEAAFSLRLAQEQGWHTVLVITDNYHTRRSKWTFQHAYRGSGITVVVVPATPDWLAIDGWWKQERSLLAVLEEYEKMIFYLLRGYLI